MYIQPLSSLIDPVYRYYFIEDRHSLYGAVVIMLALMLHSFIRRVCAWAIFGYGCEVGLGFVDKNTFPSSFIPNRSGNDKNGPLAESSLNISMNSDFYKEINKL